MAPPARRARLAMIAGISSMLLFGANLPPAAAARALRQDDNAGEVIVVRDPGAADTTTVVVARPVHLCRTAASMLSASPNFSILSAALDADPVLRSQLDDPNTPFTFFAPTDASFMAFFDALDLSRKEGTTHPVTAAALRFHLLPGTARRMDSFGANATVPTALGADLQVLSPEAVANLARAAAMRAAAANGTAPAPENSDATAAFFAALAPLFKPVADLITDDGQDADGKAFLAAMAGLAGSLVEAVTPGASRRRVPRMCEDGCRWTVAGPPTGGAGDGAKAFNGVVDKATNNATVWMSGAACSGVLSVVDEVLLPELLGTSVAGKGEAAVSTVSVGDGAGKLVSRVVVPAGPGPRNVTVELEGGGGAAGKAKQPAPAPVPAPALAEPAAAAAAAAAAAPAPAPALRRRVNPEPVDIINPVVADAVGKGPTPPERAADGGPAVVAAPAAAAPAPAPLAKKEEDKKKKASPPPEVPEDTVLNAGPAIPPAGA